MAKKKDKNRQDSGPQGMEMPVVPSGPAPGAVGSLGEQIKSLERKDFFGDFCGLSEVHRPHGNCTGAIAAQGGYGGAITQTGTREGRKGDSQGMPTVNTEPDIQSRVIADIEKRRELGISRYGTALQPNNGRNALLDLYEELIDAVMYTKQRLVEQEGALTSEQIIKALVSPGMCDSDTISKVTALVESMIGKA